MRKAFTLIELLVVIAIIAVLAAVLFLTLNPAQLFSESHDANRISDLNVLAANLAEYTQTGGSLGSSSTIYISIPDPTATTTAGTNCAGLGFPSIGYHCAASSTYKNINGTGWIPVNFTNLSGGSSLGTLPVDPVNSTSSGEYYQYSTNGGTQWEVEATPQSPKYVPQPSLFVVGTTRDLLPETDATYSIKTYAVGPDPTAIAFDPDTNTIWTVNSSSTLTQISDTTFATSTYSGINAGGQFSIAWGQESTDLMTVAPYNNYVTDIDGTTYATTSAYLGTNANGTPSIAFAADDNYWIANGVEGARATCGIALMGDEDGTRVADGYNTISGIGGCAPGEITGLMSSGGPDDGVDKAGWFSVPVLNKVIQMDVTGPPINIASTSVYAVGSSPEGVALDTNTYTVWVANSGDGTVTEINPATQTTATYTIGGSPYAIVFDPHTNSLWVTDEYTGTITQINDATNAIHTYQNSGGGSYGIAFDSNTNSIWVANYANSSVTEFVPSY